ncbi:MFS transporter [Asanoa iriomotensis]|uniref:MFS transporter n=1 Tax=Asanoa iriomotensis TaxID=234613 RepID=A0ABQ4CDF3_9ACTN|nr:MFS transporter [Asanoa iriomotensis]GIF60801.1 MFS transporter [Asanoa iriomotensis]
MPTADAPNLWRHLDFRRLWGARSVSMLGTQVTVLAMPYIAAVNLNATPMELALLVAAGFLPWLLISVPAGVWVDRLPRRRVLVGCDWGRAAVLLALPTAALLGALAYWQLVLATLVVGTLDVFFDLAGNAYLPTVVGPELLPEGNAKLAASAAVTTIGGRGLGGGLVALLTGPGALVADAVSYVVSALLLRRITVAEPAVTAGERRAFVAEARQGLRFLVRQRTLRAFVGEACVSNIGACMNSAVAVLFAVQVLHLGAGGTGLALACLGVGGLVASALSSVAVARFGVGGTIIGACALGGVGGLLGAAAAGPPAVAWLVLSVGNLLWGASLTVSAVVGGSVRQALVPAHLRGRVMGSATILVTGMNPVGAVLGGLLATAFGLRATMVVAGLVMLAATAWPLASPLRVLRDYPTAPDMRHQPTAIAAA